ncbi:MAG: hypothetical protein CL858_04670 [Cupriavidus sp.]|jgi:hypothetical protein|uniref:hypothetical protein n=1 Tax=Sphingomonadales TaxID=204457 RepID=UPI000C5890C0|nr:MULTISPECIES: hypothetical protein [Sphingomonadaceae]MBU64746.1 hypothetical protein [Cupriavidus sp.]MBS89792.1 hypothetical protein [Sphingobium sp.]MCP4028382.1 hypothetical protein [Sphingomonas sp.]RSU73931.1 hypothetical protein DAH54_21565 [Sphingomonas koreensis]RSV51774.1 hypothetical protein CA229_19530 [Sphingomonas koreensis]|tara:strand:+ start:211 stop:939 length:729 start_codon:yes stop_codon:yes gene_type:complete
MGLDDRDYMRERYRQRQGLPAQGLRWNDRKTRCELDVPLGSASWVSGSARKGSWFEAKNRGHDYQRGRWRPKRSSGTLRTAIVAGVAVALLATGIGARGWIAQRYEALVYPQGRGFPASGTVSVPVGLDLKRVVAKLTAQGGAENTIIQMIDAKTGRNALSVYIRAHERVTVPVPIGRFRLRLVHGREWTDAKTLFGKGTIHDEIEGTMRFTRKLGHILDLGLGRDSNLTVRRIAARPAPLA